MSILVTGGTGTVGGEVVRRLIAAGESLRVLTRSQEKVDGLPEGAEGVVGDLASAETLDAAFNGVDRLFLLTALGPNETDEGLAAVEAARNAGVDTIVYMTVHKLRDAPHIPHFGSKVPVEDAIAASGSSYTFIQPNYFFQNDIWFRDPILAGVYAAPVSDLGVSRVDVRDIADASVRALTSSEFAGGAYPLVGPDALTGDQVAGTYAKHLGQEVAYAGRDLDAWAEQSKGMMPDWMVDDLKIMFEYVFEHGLIASDEDLSRCRAILGREPRSFDDFAAELISVWTADR